MTPKNILNITNRADFREWLAMNTGYTGWGCGGIGIILQENHS